MKSKQQKVYLIGKVSNLPYKEVFNRFYKANAEINKLGHQPINPLFLVPENTTWNEAMKICIAALMRADAYHIVGNDYETSAGAKLELQLCKQLEIPQFAPST